MTFLKYTLLVLFLLVGNLTFAQKNITGFLKDKDSGLPIESASIVLYPDKIGTVSDKDGAFRFEDLTGNKYNIEVSMLGYHSVIMKVNAGENLEILLEQNDQQINEVEVIGNFRQTELIETPMKEQLSVLPAIATIASSEIEKQGAVTLVDAMKYMPGGWTETRGRKVKQFFTIRGQKYPYPSYSINGIWQKEFHETTYFFNSSNIEEITVVRSGNALLKSLSALTGVIDVKTRMPEKSSREFYLKYGSLNTYQSGISIGNKKNGFSYNGAVNISGIDGQEHQNGHEKFLNFHGATKWQINLDLEWSVNVFYMNGSRQLVQPNEPADQKFRNQKEEYDPLNTIMVSSLLRYQPKETFSNELHVNFAHRKPNYKSENLTTGKVTEYEETDYEFTLNQINSVAINDANTMRFGALYNYWQAPEGKRFYYGRKGEVHTVSGVVVDQHAFGRWLLDGGFRLTREYYSEWGSFSIEGSGGKFTKVAPIIDLWQPWNWQSTLGLSWQMAKQSSLHWSFAAGTVAPRKGALDGNGETPENEIRKNIDFGWIKQLDNKGRISATVFLVDRKDAIDYSGKTIEQGDLIMELYQNTDKRNYGLELEAKSAIWKNYLSAFANLTLMKGEIELEGEWTNDDEMPQVIANAGANFQKGKVDVNIFGNYIGEYKNDRFVSKSYLNENGKAPLGNFVNFDLTAGYTTGNSVKTRLFIEVKNLFDKAFQTVPGYPDYGRIISFGLNLRM